MTSINIWRGSTARSSPGTTKNLSVATRKDFGTIHGPVDKVNKIEKISFILSDNFEPSDPPLPNLYFLGFVYINVTCFSFFPFRFLGF